MWTKTCIIWNRSTHCTALPPDLMEMLFFAECSIVRLDVAHHWWVLEVSKALFSHSLQTLDTTCCSCGLQTGFYLLSLSRVVACQNPTRSLSSGTSSSYHCLGFNTHTLFMAISHLSCPSSGLDQTRLFLSYFCGLSVSVIQMTIMSL